ALTDGVEAISRFKRDHPLFVHASLALASPNCLDPLGGLTLTLNDFASVESFPLAGGVVRGVEVVAGCGHAV
ncbi:hypothetical protein A2U01_0057004, partial [Trifolium medium]|nr:hypothetical protein [Trifolium medium]